MSADPKVLLNDLLKTALKSVAPDQLENFVFEIRDVSLKLKDGTALSSDSTLRLSPRSFKNELDKASGRPLRVTDAIVAPFLGAS